MKKTIFYLEITSGGVVSQVPLRHVQTISIPEERYDEYRRSSDFIKEYIFPGGCVPCLSALTAAMKAGSSLRCLGFALKSVNACEVARNGYRNGEISGCAFTAHIVLGFGWKGFQAALSCSGCLASLSGSVEHLENIGPHYYQTLMCWRDNFLANCRYNCTLIPLLT